MEGNNDDENKSSSRSEDYEATTTTRSASTLETLKSNLEKQSKRKAAVSNDLQRLKEAIDERKSVAASVRELLLPLQSLKVLEEQESVSVRDYDAKRCELESEVSDLEERIAGAAAAGGGLDSESLLAEDLDRLLDQSLDKLNLAKKDLAARLRALLSVKRQFDDVPTQAELIQYDHRFSELNSHIEEKHRQTRKYYATYNALLEIKELMLKETSLLNSISSQFQDAITSADGRMKLIGSMEGIVKGSQQKLQKVELRLQEEQQACDALRRRYAAAMTEQRRCYSLLKAFQEECAKNTRLRSPSSA